MKKALLFLSLVSAPPLAGEGKWTPQQVLELNPADLKKQGLQVAPQRLWDPKRGTGLLAGTVNVGGCSGAFISESGLVITNHHCAFPIIQEHSTPERDLISQGFLARSREEELPGKGARIQVPRAFTDVTGQMLAAVPAGADDLTRYKALERKEKELIAECEKRPATRCIVSRFEGGLRFTLIDSVELTDSRLGYAPPRSGGEYGGEVGKWMWPRPPGGCAILRAYVAPDGSAAPYNAQNVPYKAEFFFPLATQGVKPDDFVMVLGYPGTTFRALLADEMAERQTRYYPRVIDVYGELIRILEEAGAKDPAGKIAVASNLKGLHNRYKNSGGQIAGLKRGHIVDKQRAAEEAVVAWARTRPAFAGALQARTDLLALREEGVKTFEHDMVLDTLAFSAKSTSLATRLARLSQERVKPDLEREPEFMDRELPRLKDWLEGEQKNFFAPADKRALLSLVRRAQSLGEGERIAAIDRYFGPVYSEKETAAKVEALYAGTKVLGLAERQKMAGETEAQLRAREDPLLGLGFDLAAEMAVLKAARDRRAGANLRLRPEWRRAVIAHAGKPVAPDANGSLRVSFAKVKGYAPRDGIFYTPQTTLAGVLEKNTGAVPYDVPEKVLRAAEAQRHGPWKDARLQDVPVNFLSDADTTGGNSGSPTVNGKGQLVGVNFDRVWENVANDFGYNPDVARNVSVDVRYVLWLLDQVEDADALLRELGVRKGPQAKGSR